MHYTLKFFSVKFHSRTSWRLCWKDLLRKIMEGHQSEPPNTEQCRLELSTTSNDLNNIKIDLENWMRDLPGHLTCVPLIHLAIPGSHNSFSYSISPNSGVSPDSPPFVQNLGKWCKPLANRIIFNWSQGQKEDVIKQLYGGIRYFDVRLVIKGDDILIAHGLYGGEIQQFLEEMNSFLEAHGKEIVILDFQHFYEFRKEHHERMISMILHIFGNKICRRQTRISENTLALLWRHKHQVLIIYRHQVTRFNDIFWPSGAWVTCWPNKVDVNDLIEYLNEGLKCRKVGLGYVSQGILTPDPKYIASHVFGSLKNLANKTNKKVLSWLETKSCGTHGINVVICDFVERYNFCRSVVILNYKNIEDHKKHFSCGEEPSQYLNY